MKSSPIDSPAAVLHAAFDQGSAKFKIRSEWTLAACHTSVKSKEAWCAYFTGPAQLIRLKTMELQEEPKENWESCLLIGGGFQIAGGLQTEERLQIRRGLQIGGRRHRLENDGIPVYGSTNIKANH